MQVCNLAPMTGFFQPAVRLGERVEVGTPLGEISDVLGERRVTVASQQAGMVLVLHTCSLARQGDSLAVILEMEHRS